MALNSIRVSLKQVADALANRLDHRYHLMSEQTIPILNGLVEPIRLGAVAESMENGANLPAFFYSLEDEKADAHYASVSAFSQFQLDVEKTQPIRIPEDVASDPSAYLDAIEAKPNDLLVTRSGTPGIAFPVAPGDAESLPVVPSGFVIRVKLPSGVPAPYIAAILNHPLWRVTSLALSAGKRQDNISQPSLESMPLPRVPEELQSQIARSYSQLLGELDQVALERTIFAQECDEVLNRILGLPLPELSPVHLSETRVRLADVVARADDRLDHRLYGPVLARAKVALEAFSPIPLASLLPNGIIRSGQPNLPKGVDVDEVTPVAVATSAIQDGQIVESLLKATTDASVEKSSLEPCDLLVAMDGDGSLGKAAVFEYPDRSATTDSHLAILRFGDDDQLPHALACWLNSSWGKLQTNGLMAGSTGQTQLSSADLCSVLVAGDLSIRAKEVASAYREVVSTYEPKVVRARRLVCEHSASVSNELISAGALKVPQEVADWIGDPQALFGFLSLVYPSVRNQ